MNILVCGSEGYLGCVLWRKLKLAGHEVKGLDRGLYGIRNHDDDKFDRADAVINLAALVGEPVCAANPTLTDAYNVEWAVEQAHAAKKAGAKLFVQMSTCSVYGEQSATTTCTTETRISDPDTMPPYARSKALVERRLMAEDWGTMGMRIVRLGTLCGPSPRMRFDLMANGFALRAARGRRVTIYNPDSIRPHVSTWSVADMLAWLCVHWESTATLSNYVGNQHTVADLAAMAARHARADVMIDKSKAVNDRRSYRVECSPWFSGMPDMVPAAMEHMVRHLIDFEWAGANPNSPAWGNTGWRFEDEA